MTGWPPARDEAAGAPAVIVIVIVGQDSRTREILYRELSKRYAGDYQIVICGRPAELAAQLRDLSAAGVPVALVIGGVGARDPDGIEALAAVRAIDPRAVRVAAVGWGDWDSVRSVLGAVAVGSLDHWVIRPVQAPAEEFHRSVTEFLREWGSQQGGGLRGGAGDRPAVVGAVAGAAGPVRPAPGASRLLRRHHRPRPADAAKNGPDRHRRPGADDPVLRAGLQFAAAGNPA
jgi:hypothetical protein